MVFLSHKAFADEIVKSKYFNIHVYNGVDRFGLLNKLDAEYFVRRNIANFEGKNDADFDALLGETLDAIYLQVSDIIEIGRAHV